MLPSPTSAVVPVEGCDLASDEVPDGRLDGGLDVCRVPDDVAPAPDSPPAAQPATSPATDATAPPSTARRLTGIPNLWSATRPSYGAESVLALTAHGYDSRRRAALHRGRGGHTARVPTRDG